MPAPFISICIPAYNREDYLRNLLDSIAMQSFKDFEVIVSDDSSNDSVEKVVKDYQNLFTIHYFHNAPAAGTPQNWNLAIEKAHGTWIKLMHDDDSFSRRDSLQHFVNAINNNPDSEFIFSGYYNVSNKSSQPQAFPSQFVYQTMLKNPAVLLAGNIIGPPSVVIHKKNTGVEYNRNLQWLVDIDFYIHNLKNAKVFFIKDRLVNIGINPQQVTNQSLGVPEIEIPEFFMVYEQLSSRQKKSILVYDAAWRLIRNLNITSVNQIRIAGWEGDIPSEIIKMINFQKPFGKKLLRFGPASKALMSISFITNR